MPTGSYFFNPGIPEDSAIINQYGQILTATGSTIQWYAPPAEGCNSTPYVTSSGQCPGDEHQYIQNNCGNPVAGTCSAIDNFAASVDENGGWSALFGGYVPGIALPAAYFIGLGEFAVRHHPDWTVGVDGYMFSDPNNGQTYFVQGTYPFGTISGSCTNTGQGCIGLTFAEAYASLITPNGGFTSPGGGLSPSEAYFELGGYLLGSVQQLLTVIYMHYPVTSEFGEPNIHGGYPGGCFTGCLSPASWPVFIRNLGAVQGYNQQYINDTGQVLIFGQPWNEAGTTGSLSTEALTMPTLQDSLTTAFFNGFKTGNGAYSPGILDEMWNPANPKSPANPSNPVYANNTATMGCPTQYADSTVGSSTTGSLACQGAITMAALEELELQAWFDPNNPDSFVNWFGGRPVSPISANYDCALGCGWTEFPIATGSPLDPGCSDSLCVNGISANSTSTSRTHYLVSNQYALVLNALGIGPSPFVDQIPKVELNAIGIKNQATVLAWFQKQQKIATDIFNGKAINSAGAATLAELIGEGAAISGPDSHFNQQNMDQSIIGPDSIARLNVVFSLTWGDTNYLQQGGYFPLNSFQLWQTGIDTMQYPVPLDHSYDWIRTMLDSYPIGKRNLGAILFQNQGAYTLTGQLVIQALAQCSRPCTEASYGKFIQTNLFKHASADPSNSTEAPAGSPFETPIQQENSTTTVTVTVNNSTSSSNSTQPPPPLQNSFTPDQRPGYYLVLVIGTLVCIQMAVSIVRSRKREKPPLPPPSTPKVMLAVKVDMATIGRKTKTLNDRMAQLESRGLLDRPVPKQRRIDEI